MSHGNASRRSYSPHMLKEDAERLLTGREKLRDLFPAPRK